MLNPNQQRQCLALICKRQCILNEENVMRCPKGLRSMGSNDNPTTTTTTTTTISFNCITITKYYIIAKAN